MERTTPNPIPLAHQPMKSSSKIHRVPSPLSLEAVDPTNKARQDAMLAPPVTITTPFQLIEYIAEMMMFRDLEKYPTEPFSVVKQAWEDSVNALDNFVRSGLGLLPDSEEARLIHSMIMLLDRRKLQDQLPLSRTWNNDYQYHWTEMRDIAQAYLHRNQL